MGNLIAIFAVLIQVMFIGLKLSNVIHWGWIKTMSPFLIYGSYIGLVIFASFLYVKIYKENPYK